MRLVTNALGFFVGVLLVLLFAVNAYPQTGVITRPINLIVDPDTDEPPIWLLLPPEAFRIVAPKEQSGFFRIRTEAGETGRVFERGREPLQPKGLETLDQTRRRLPRYEAESAH